MTHRASEIGSPSLNLSIVGIHPVEAHLRILVFPFDGTGIDLKQDMAAIVAPMNVLFNSFIVGDLARRLVW